MNLINFVNEQSLVYKFKDDLSRNNIQGIGLHESLGVKRFICWNEHLPFLPDIVGHYNFQHLVDDIKPLTLSLADENGIPIFPSENAFEIIRELKGLEDNLSSEFVEVRMYDIEDLMKLFRINKEEAFKLVFSVNKKEDLKSYIESQKSRWKQEADSVLSRIKELKPIFNRKNMSII